MYFVIAHFFSKIAQVTITMQMKILFWLNDKKFRVSIRALNATPECDTESLCEYTHTLRGLTHVATILFFSLKEKAAS